MKLTALAILCLCAIGCTGQSRDVSTVTEFRQSNPYAILQHDLAQLDGERLMIFHDTVPSITGAGSYSTYLRISSLTVRGDDVLEFRYAERLP
jgi:hypothetical protein